MKTHVNIYTTSRFSQIALQTATEIGYLEVVERLIMVKADINASRAYQFGSTALQMTTQMRHLEMVKGLLKAKVFKIIVLIVLNNVKINSNKQLIKLLKSHVHKS